MLLLRDIIDCSNLNVLEIITWCCFWILHSLYYHKNGIGTIKNGLCTSGSHVKKLFETVAQLESRRAAKGNPFISNLCFL